MAYNPMEVFFSDPHEFSGRFIYDSKGEEIGYFDGRFIYSYSFDNAKKPLGFYTGDEERGGFFYYYDYEEVKEVFVGSASSSGTIYDSDGNVVGVFSGRYIRPCAPRGKKDGCYITTACVDRMGLPDKGIVMQTFRGLRDNYMKKSQEGKELIKNYYNDSPFTVSGIEAQKYSSEIKREIYYGSLMSCFRLICQGNRKAAVNEYAKMHESLQKEFGNKSKTFESLNTATSINNNRFTKSKNSGLLIPKPKTIERINLDIYKQII